MAGMLQLVFGAGLAVGIVLAFWVFLGFIEDMQTMARRLR